MAREGRQSLQGSLMLRRCGNLSESPKRRERRTSRGLSARALAPTREVVCALTQKVAGPRVPRAALRVALAAPLQQQGGLGYYRAPGLEPPPLSPDALALLHVPCSCARALVSPGPRRRVAENPSELATWLPCTESSLVLSVSCVCARPCPSCLLPCPFHASTLVVGASSPGGCRLSFGLLLILILILCELKRSHHGFTGICLQKWPITKGKGAIEV